MNPIFFIVETLECFFFNRKCNTDNDNNKSPRFFFCVAAAVDERKFKKRATAKATTTPRNNNGCGRTKEFTLVFKERKRKKLHLSV